MLEKIYKHKWKRKKVKWNDGSLKCSKCDYVFEVGDIAYLFGNKWLGSVLKILCLKCKNMEKEN